VRHDGKPPRATSVYAVPHDSLPLPVAQKSLKIMALIPLRWSQSDNGAMHKRWLATVR
jgi:hypothetical protein